MITKLIRFDWANNKLMIKKNILIVLIFIQSINFSIQAQVVVDLGKTRQTREELKVPLAKFKENLLVSDLDTLLKTLFASKEFDSKNQFHNFLIGYLLKYLDFDKSFFFIEKAYNSDRNNLEFVFEYAICLHKKQQYARAAKLYEQYLEEYNDVEQPMNAMLADCYLNLGNTKKAIKKWKQTNYPETDYYIEHRMGLVYNSWDAWKVRNNLKKEISSGNLSKIDDLIFNDVTNYYNWADMTNKDFLEADMKFVENIVGKNHEDVQILKALISINDETKKDEVLNILTLNKIIINNGTLTKFSKTVSNVLKICFGKGFLSTEDFAKKRGDELLEKAKSTKSVELLNIYLIFLSFNQEKKIEAFKMGWQTCKDEDAALNYLSHQNRQSICSIIEKLMSDFPNSARIHWNKVDCMAKNDRKYKRMLIEGGKKEFKSTEKDPIVYSRRLNEFFNIIEQKR
jgi:tetratricopeptide (TPR) repeat protein